MKDVFICHASKDKELIVNPLAAALEEHGISYWLDIEEILWGDSITEKINEGLRNSTYFIVVFTETFISRNWPKIELTSQIHREASSGKRKILPLFACDPESKQQILDEFQLISDKMYLSWDDGINHIIRQLQRLLNKQPSTPTQSKRRTIPIPTMTKKTTQYEKDKFIEQTFEEIKSYFLEGLAQLQQHPPIDTNLKELTSQAFISKIYRDGELICSCKIWIAASYGNVIGYEAGSPHSFSHSEAFNEMVTLNDEDLTLRFMMGMIGMTRSKEKFTPEEVAEELWKRFTSRLER